MTLPYTITLIEQQNRVNAAGKLDTVKVVHYKTALGDTGSIEIPNDMFSAETANNMIADEVAHIAQLRGIK